MANKLFTALKENKNDVRKKVVIAGGIVVATVVAGVVLTRMNANRQEFILITENAEGLIEAVADATPVE